MFVAETLPGWRFEPCRLLEDRADRIEGVRLGGSLVGAISLDARKAQGKATGITRAFLNVVERDLDDELGAYVHGVLIASDLERKQPFGLSRQHRVGEPFESSRA